MSVPEKVVPFCPPCEFDLSSVLEGLPHPAVLLTPDCRITASNRAYRRRFNDEQRVCGRKCFEVSHGLRVPCWDSGESCPLQAAEKNGVRAQALHVHQTPDGPQHHLVSVYPIFGRGGGIEGYLEVVRRSPVGNAKGAGGGLVGRSEPFRRMLDLVARAAPSDATVMLLGESGSGKELVASAVHRMSHRSDLPFVPVDCSGLSESLFESELFGHEKGAFTGAHQRKKGLAEVAQGGTLFLDEVGDIPPAQQVKLLRLLETGTFRRVGSVELRSSDFRLICATHRDLRQMVEEGSFRSDLYFRISVFPIRIPPLRERADDIPLLVDCFLDRLGVADKLRVAPETVGLLQGYPYPGNVRELFNIVERACLLRDADTILPRHLPAECQGCDAPPSSPLNSSELMSLEDAEERYLRWVVARFPGDRAELASRLGISERTLYRKLKRSHTDN